MNCEMCSEVYDQFDRKPMTLIPCGHTLCLECVNKLKESTETNKCIQCQENIQEPRPSYAILKLLEQNILVDYHHLKQRQTLNDLINHINDTKTSLLLSKENKIQDNQYKINTLKNDISNQTTDLMNILLNNQETIVQEANRFQQKLYDNLKFDSHDEETFLNDLETKDLNLIERTDLTAIRTRLNKIKSNLMFKSTLLNEIDLTLESNNFFNYEPIKVGDIIVNGVVKEHSTTDQRSDSQVKAINLIISQMNDKTANSAQQNMQLNQRDTTQSQANNPQLNASVQTYIQANQPAYTSQINSIPMEIIGSIVSQLNSQLAANRAYLNQEEVESILNDRVQTDQVSQVETTQADSVLVSDN